VWLSGDPAHEMTFDILAYMRVTLFTNVKPMQQEIDRDGIFKHLVFSSNKRKTRSNNNNKQIR
jgi:hypothetical protein